MPRPDRRAYVRSINEIQRNYTGLERETINRATAMLRDLRAQISGEILTGEPESFTAYRLTVLKRNIDKMLTRLESDLDRVTRDGVAASYNLGAHAATDPIQALGFGVSFYQPSTAQVVTFMDYTAGLITNITGDTLGKIDRTLRLAGLGEQSPYEAMRQITQILGVQAGRRETARGIAYRAEMILRTELQRAFNVANDSQMQLVGSQIPGITKRWLHSGKALHPRIEHIRVHMQTMANPIPYDEPFIVGGEAMRYSLDPAASAEQTVNCGCREILIHPDVGVIDTPLDDTVRALSGAEAEGE